MPGSTSRRSTQQSGLECAGLQGVCGRSGNRDPRTATGSRLLSRCLLVVRLVARARASLLSRLLRRITGTTGETRRRGEILGCHGFAGPLLSAGSLAVTVLSFGSRLGAHCCLASASRSSAWIAITSLSLSFFRSPHASAAEGNVSVFQVAAFLNVAIRSFICSTHTVRESAALAAPSVA
jgi:hypothetical protein